MNNKYLVICRNEDEPHIALMSKEEFEQEGWKESFNNHKFLDYLPNLLDFPVNSVFIMAGTVISK